MTTLHPSITHINAKNLSEQTIKMINKMVEKVNEMESKVVKIYRLECVNEDGNLECNGYYFNRAIAEKEGKKMDEYPMNKKYSIIQKVVEIEMDDHITDINHLTAENARMREAVATVQKIIQKTDAISKSELICAIHPVLNPSLSITKCAICYCDIITDIDGLCAECWSKN